LDGIVTQCNGNGGSDDKEYWSWNVTTCGKNKRRRGLLAEREEAMETMRSEEEMEKSVNYLLKSEDEKISGATILSFPYSGKEPMTVCQLANSQELKEKFGC
jgi:pyruvoyl-dependent arginine decarboxylase (PvlArgDC)